MDSRPIGSAALTLVQGDITHQRVDAIVNAANSRLAGGGGVDGAIHRAGGPAIMAECRLIGACPTGGAVSTCAGNLSARWVIHAVGPIYHDGQHQEPELLASTYRSAMEEAERLGAATVAFPSLSTGTYGYPVSLAAPIALGTVAEFLHQHHGPIREVRFVLFDNTTFEAFRQALPLI